MGTQTYTASPQCFCVQKRASNGGRKRATHFAYPPTDDPKMPLSLLDPSAPAPPPPPSRRCALLPPPALSPPFLPPPAPLCSLRWLSLPLSSLPGPAAPCSLRRLSLFGPRRAGREVQAMARRRASAQPCAASERGSSGGGFMARLGGGVACPGAPFAPRASRSPASLLAGGRRDVPEGRVPSLRAGDRASIHAGDCFWGGIGGGGVARDHAEAGSCADRPEIGRFRPESPTARLCSARRGTEAGGARRSFGCAVGERTVWVCNPFFLRDPKKQIGLVFASPLLETVLGTGG